jgi:hypothetical protein
MIHYQLRFPNLCEFILENLCELHIVDMLVTTSYIFFCRVA